MLKQIIPLSLMLLPSVIWGQSTDLKIKKKYLGTYQGQMNAYYLTDGNTTFEVESTTCKVQLKSNGISLELDNVAKEGNYSVLFATKEYTVLEANYDNTPMRDRFILPKKGKVLTREGLTPQPNVTLNKVKK